MTNKKDTRGDKKDAPDKDAPAAPKDGTADMSKASGGRKKATKIAGFEVYHPGKPDEAWDCGACGHRHGVGQFHVCQSCGGIMSAPTA